MRKHFLLAIKEIKSMLSTIKETIKKDEFSKQIKEEIFELNSGIYALEKKYLENEKILPLIIKTLLPMILLLGSTISLVHLFPTIEYLFLPLVLLGGVAELISLETVINIIMAKRLKTDVSNITESDLENTINALEKSIELKKKIRHLKSLGKSHEEIMRILEIEYEIRNSIDLDYIVRTTESKVELEEKLNNHTYTLNRNTPKEVQKRINDFLKDYDTNKIYSINPRNTTKQELDRLLEPIKDLTDSAKTFEDYLEPVKEIKSVEKEDIVKYELQQAKKMAYYFSGQELEYIKMYEKSLLEALRSYARDDHIPYSLKVLISEFTNGECVEYSKVIALALKSLGKNVRIERGIIDSIDLYPENIKNTIENPDTKDMHGVHYYAVETKEDGTEWIYDSAEHLMIEKNYYYALNRVRDVKIDRTSEQLQEQVEELNKKADEREETEEEIKERIKALVEFLDREEELKKKLESSYRDLATEEFKFFKEKVGYQKIKR